MKNIPTFSLYIDTTGHSIRRFLQIITSHVLCTDECLTEKRLGPLFPEKVILNHPSLSVLGAFIYVFYGTWFSKQGIENAKIRKDAKKDLE